VVDEEKSQHHAAPAVRRLARELGVALSEIRGTGRNGRIVEEDLRNYIKAAMARTPAAGGTICLSYPRWIFPNLVPLNCGLGSHSPRHCRQRCNARGDWVPHVTQYDEADITDLEAFRKAEAEQASSGACA